jgi:hypothetical protein
LSLGSRLGTDHRSRHELEDLEALELRSTAWLVDPNPDDFSLAK